MAITDNCGFQNFSQPPIIYDNIESQYNNVTVHENSCPYCDEELPNILPEKLQIKLLSLQNNPITEYDRYSFCVMHRAELHIIPNGLLKGYPEFIDFNQLVSRIQIFKDELLEIINRNLASYYREMAFSIYQEIGYNKAKSPTILFNRCEIFQVLISKLIFFILICFKKLY